MLGDGGLAVGARHTDHQQVARRVAVEGGRKTGHDRAHGPRCDARLDDSLVEQLGDEVLAQQPDGTAFHRLARVGVPVADQAGHAAEEIAGHDPAAVVRDAADLHRREVADRLEHVYVVEEEVHGHGSHDGPDSVACPGHPRVTAAMGVWSCGHVMSWAWSLVRLETSSPATRGWSGHRGSWGCRSGAGRSS